MVQYGGAEVRNVNTTVSPTKGSDDTILFGDVNFEYRMPGESVWKQGHIVIMTLFDPMGFRYTCGNEMYP